MLCGFTACNIHALSLISGVFVGSARGLSLSGRPDGLNAIVLLPVIPRPVALSINPHAPLPGSTNLHTGRLLHPDPALTDFYAGVGSHGCQAGVHLHNGPNHSVLLAILHVTN